VFERDHLDLGVGAAVDALHDALEPIDIRGAVGDQQRIAVGVRGKVALLRQQRAQPLR
jgi:hypothetical protein